MRERSAIHSEVALPRPSLTKVLSLRVASLRGFKGARRGGFSFNAERQPAGEGNNNYNLNNSQPPPHYKHPNADSLGWIVCHAICGSQPKPKHQTMQERAVIIAARFLPSE